MTVVLSLLMVNALLGAWDTLWYHEYRAKLTAKTWSTAPELRLHVARDAIYVGLYGFLAVWEPHGFVVAVVLVALVAEVVITLCDFVVEDRDRHAIGGMAAGERVLHSLMAIVYGAMLAKLLPLLVKNMQVPSGVEAHGAPTWLSLAAFGAAAGIAVSGGRDALALRGIDPVWGGDEGSNQTRGRRHRSLADRLFPAPRHGSRP